MNATDLETIWQSRFPGVLPVADELKYICASGWVRFHSLPKSKRYPEDTDEERIIMNRHNTILDAIWPHSSPLVVIQTAYSSSSKDIPGFEEPGWTFWKTFDPFGDADSWWHLYFQEQIWQPGVFDQLILQVAHEKVFNLMVLDGAADVLYHPYDGGLDLIFADPENIPPLRFHFADWLSPYPNGY